MLKLLIGNAEIILYDGVGHAEFKGGSIPEIFHIMDATSFNLPTRCVMNNIMLRASLICFAVHRHECGFDWELGEDSFVDSTFRTFQCNSTSVVVDEDMKTIHIRYRHYMSFDSTHELQLPRATIDLNLGSMEFYIDTGFYDIFDKIQLKATLCFMAAAMKKNRDDWLSRMYTQIEEEKMHWIHLPLDNPTLFWKFGVEIIQEVMHKLFLDSKDLEFARLQGTSQGLRIIQDFPFAKLHEETPKTIAGYVCIYKRIFNEWDRRDHIDYRSYEIAKLAVTNTLERVRDEKQQSVTNRNTLKRVREEEEE